MEKSTLNKKCSLTKILLGLHAIQATKNEFKHKKLSSLIQLANKLCVKIMNLIVVSQLTSRLHQMN